MRRAIANRRGSTGRFPVLCLLGPVLVVTLAAAAPRRVPYGPPAPPPPPTPYDLCDAATTMARPAAMPRTLLQSIARVESGRLDPSTGRARSWPWTINVEGAGSFFESKADAIAAVEAHRAKGVRSIDVGCMQVNLMHHPTAFPDLETAFDPGANATYAARFLSALYVQSKDWSLATAFYHSQIQERGEEYQRRVFGQVNTPMGPPTGLGNGKPLNTTLPNTTAFRAIPPSASMFGAIPPPTLMFGSFGPVPIAPVKR